MTLGIINPIRLDLFGWGPIFLYIEAVGRWMTEDRRRKIEKKSRKREKFRDRG
jgi:hypothetical protein